VARNVRWRVRFGYDGVGFYGWARQPGRRTVEGEITKRLAEAGVIDSASGSLDVASRTDRGVSARANAVALPAALPPRGLLRLLNGVAPDLYFTAAAPMAEGERIRAAVRRTYRYFEARPFQGPGRREEAAALFSGSIDVRSLGRRLPTDLPTWRTVESVSLRPFGAGEVVEVRAPSFVWGMVRKIVGAIREVDAGRLSIARLRAALEGRTRLTLPLAEAEPLVLWEVEYASPWTVLWTGPNRRQTLTLREELDRQWVRTQVLDAVASDSHASAETLGAGGARPGEAR
jgi:tRNA pseudouridine38-40 synthase